jgi:hypothetical protein
LEFGRIGFMSAFDTVLLLALKAVHTDPVVVQVRTACDLAADTHEKKGGRWIFILSVSIARLRWVRGPLRARSGRSALRLSASSIGAF